MNRIGERFGLIIIVCWFQLWLTGCSTAPAPAIGINAQNNSIDTTEPKHLHPATPQNSSSTAAAANPDLNINRNAPISPDPHLTPGDALEVTKADICTPGYSKKVRDVPQAVKEEAYKEYGITTREPKEYEVDHLISLELGGSNSLKNLWPESYLTEPWNAHVKDKLENKLHQMICTDQIDIKAAQAEIAGDWITAYRKYVGDEPESGGSGERSNPPSSAASASLPHGKNGNQTAIANKSEQKNPSESSRAEAIGGAVVGNRNSHKYHRSDCPDYGKVSEKNKVEFASAEEAEKAGYTLARNCPRSKD